MGKVSRKDSKGRVLRTGEYERPNHTYEYRYSIKGVRYSEYAETLNDLRKKEARVNKKKMNQLNVPLSSRLTVCDLARRYIVTKKDLADSTLYNYQRTLDNYLDGSDFGNMKAENVRKTDIVKFYDTFVDKKGKKKSGVILMAQRLLRPAFQMGMDDDILLKNPFDNFMRYYPLSIQSKEALTIEQQEVFMDFVKHDRYYCSYYYMLVIMINTGIRFGETIGLTWKDVNLKERTISINHQLQYRNFDHTRMKFTASTPKTKSAIRTLYMVDEVYEAFKALKKEKKNNPKPVVEIDGYKDFVFTTSNGTPFQPNSFNRMLEKCVKACNEVNAKIDNGVTIPHISAHTLRHTACTRMAERKIDPKVLQYIMGHSTVTTTLNTYDHVQAQRIKEAFEEIGWKK